MPSDSACKAGQLRSCRAQHFEALQRLDGVAAEEHVELLAGLAAAYGRSREQGAEVCSWAVACTLRYLQVFQ